VSDLRAADREISPQEREYFNWDEQYAAALRRATDPNAKNDPPPPPVVKPTDSNGNGKIDPAEKQAAAKETAKLRKRYETALASPDGFDDGDGGDSGGDGSGDDSDSSNSAVRSDDDGGGVSWPLLAVLGVVILGAAVGVWRAVRGSHEEDAAAAEGAHGLDEERRPSWRERRAARREAERGGGAPNA
jgi:hypothetical protein